MTHRVKFICCLVLLVFLWLLNLSLGSIAIPLVSLLERLGGASFSQRKLGNYRDGLSDPKIFNSNFSRNRAINKWFTNANLL